MLNREFLKQTDKIQLLAITEKLVQFSAVAKQNLYWEHLIFHAVKFQSGKAIKKKNFWASGQDCSFVFLHGPLRKLDKLVDNEK